jgi:hypothetical protein
VCVEKIPKSRHPKKVCIDFAQFLLDKKEGVKWPEAYGWEIYLDGREDERIDDWMLQPTPEQIAAARRAEDDYNAAFEHAVSLVLEGIHSGGIGGWADAQPIAAGFDWQRFKGVVRGCLQRYPELKQKFPFDEDVPVAVAAGAGGG